MIKRIFVSLLVAVVAAVSSWAAQSVVQQANAAYGTEHYNKALELYLSAEKKQGTSSELCYNIGNTYYRLKDTTHAVLYYERALLLDPSNDDARYNLDFTRKKASINENSGESYFSARIASFASALSSDAWAVIGITTFILFLVSIAVYVFMDSVMVRKIGFFGGILLLLMSVVANVCAFYVHGKAVNRNSAIVTAAGPVKVSTVPRAPKDKSEVAFEIKAGYKVTINDSVTSQDTKWLDIETSAEQRGWIDAKDIERI